MNSPADALNLWRSGKHSEAEKACTAILQTSPDLIDVRGLLAQIHSTQGRHAQAAEHLQRVADLRPTDAAAWRRLGDARFAAGEYDSAVAAFSTATRIEPSHPRAHNNLGRALAMLGKLDEAVDSYRRAIAVDPNYAIAYSNLGLALTQRSEHEEALRCYDRAIAIRPDFADAHSNRGNALLRLKRPEEALKAHLRALTLEPTNVVYRCNSGNAYLEMRQLDKALEYFQEAIRTAPDSLLALNGCGNALRQLRRFDEGLACYDRALALQPDDADSQTNRAGILLDMDRFDEAIAACDDVLKRHPNMPTALLFRGLSLYFLMRVKHDEAAACFERLLAADPDYPYALGYLLHATFNTCDWSAAHRLPEAFDRVAAGKPAVTPFALMGLTDSCEMQLQCARNFTYHMHPPSPASLWSAQAARERNDRIRIAYISGDLREHALSYLMTGVFEQHDRDRFQIIGVSFGPPAATPFGARVLNSLDLFVEVKDKSQREVAQLLYDMKIDVAVDLMGHTRGGRLDIFGHRPTPVSVGYLGYPGTSGAPYLDYILADDFVIPEDQRRHYSEQVVYLPDTYQANDDRRPLAENAPSRAELGLPEEAFVFCAFNNLYKIMPETFTVWCRLLKEIPGSVLWLVGRSEAARENLIKEAQARGIEPNRLTFAGEVPYAQHLARLTRADLFLDTFPYCAGTTASDALWAGLPIVTRCGESFASRMAGSLLRTSGVPELITHDNAEYEQLALRLAKDPETLRAIRHRIETGRTTNPLFDTKRFCRHLESAYITMYERALRGDAPQSFRVP